MLNKTFRNLATITRNVTEADVTLSIMLDAKYVYITLQYITWPNN
jgi:hypothetical protein